MSLYTVGALAYKVSNYLGSLPLAAWPIKFEEMNWAKLVLQPEDKLIIPIEGARNFRLFAAISNNIIWITRNKLMN